MLVADAAGPPHSCGSKAPMGPRMSRNSSLTHSQGRGTGATLCMRVGCTDVPVKSPLLYS